MSFTVHDLRCATASQVCGRRLRCCGNPGRCVRTRNACGKPATAQWRRRLRPRTFVSARCAKAYIRLVSRVRRKARQRRSNRDSDLGKQGARLVLRQRGPLHTFRQRGFTVSPLPDALSSAISVQRASALVPSRAKWWNGNAGAAQP